MSVDPPHSLLETPTRLITIPAYIKPNWPFPKEVTIGYIIIAIVLALTLGRERRK
jgi:hypothetical protein